MQWAASGHNRSYARQLQTQIIKGAIGGGILCAVIGTVVLVGILIGGFNCTVLGTAAIVSVVS